MRELYLKKKRKIIFPTVVSLGKTGIQPLLARNESILNKDLRALRVDHGVSISEPYDHHDDPIFIVILICTSISA